MERIIRFLYLILVPVLLLPGCNSPTVSKDIAGEQLKVEWCSTPGKTLEQLSHVWTQHSEIDNYSALLTKDYHFFFAPGSVGQHLSDGYIIPPSWDKTEDITATQNMFEIADLSLDVLNSADYDYDPGGSVFTATAVMLEFYYWPYGLDFAYLTTGTYILDFEKIGGYWLINGWHDDEGGALGMDRAAYHP